VHIGVKFCAMLAMHRRSQDFLWGAIFPEKVDDLFCRRPQYTA